MSYGQSESIASDQGCFKARRHISISHETISFIFSTVEVICVVLGSVLGHVVFQSAFYHEVKDVDIALGIGVTAAPIYVLLAASLGLYQLPALLSPARTISKVALAWASIVLLITAILFLLKVGTIFSRGSILGFAFAALLLLIGTRFAVKTFARSMIAKGAMAGRAAIVIGEHSELGQWTALQLMLRVGAVEMARVPLLSNHTSNSADGTNFERLDAAIELARQTGAEELVIVVQWSNIKLLEAIRDHLRSVPLSVRLVPDQNMRSVMAPRSASGLALIPTIELQRAPLNSLECFVKRCFDLVGASIGLVILAPLLLLVAIAIKHDSPGPAIFKQRRNGFNGQQFVIYKFRSMRVLEDGAKIMQVSRGDPRVTRIGRILRQTSIDELPQLLNVLKGDMSLVGPRPHALAHDDEYRRVIANYAHRHRVKPGLTGWAQIHGYRGETKQLEKMIQRIEFDIWYINNWSLFLDLRILMRTYLALLRDEAY